MKLNRDAVRIALSLALVASLSSSPVRGYRTDGHWITLADDSGPGGDGGSSDGSGGDGSSGDN